MIDIKAFGLTILCRVLNTSSEVMVSGRCRAHPVVERPLSLQPPFNDDAVTPANFQFRFAIRFLHAILFLQTEYDAMLHHIDCQFINPEIILKNNKKTHNNSLGKDIENASWISCLRSG